MTDIPLRDYLKEQHDTVIGRLDAIVQRQDVANSRLQKAEIAIAILQWAYGLGVAVVGWIIYRAE